jgi:PadR family transcriptional regulator PadR
VPRIVTSNDAPLGTFEEQVMLAVVRTGRDGGAYGMAIRRELEQVASRDVAIGAVYATLDRLEAKKLVASERGGDGASTRRLFSVTPRGALALSETRAMRERLWKGVDLLSLLPKQG